MQGGCACDARRVREGGDWDDFNGGQVVSASRGEPLRLDKACCCILSAELTLHGVFNPSLRNLDLYKLVQPTPAVYVLRGLNGRQRSASADEAELFKRSITTVCASSAEPLRTSRQERNHSSRSQRKERACLCVNIAINCAGITRMDA